MSVDSPYAQGASDESVLTPFGELQAVRCRDALSRVHFDRCG